MKSILTLLLLLIFNLSHSQIFIIEYDTITHYTCDRNSTIEDMVKTNRFDVVERFSDPGVMVINLDEGVLNGKNGDLSILKVLDKEQSIDIIFGKNSQLTIRQGSDLKWIMVIQQRNSKSDLKHIWSFSNVRFIK